MGNISVNGFGVLNVPEFNPGSVMFGGADGNLAQDNSSFYWNNSSKTLDISGNYGSVGYAAPAIRIFNNVQAVNTTTAINSVHYALEFSSLVTKVLDISGGSEMGSFDIQLIYAGAMQSAFLIDSNALSITVQSPYNFYISELNTVGAILMASTSGLITGSSSLLYTSGNLINASGSIAAGSCPTIDASLRAFYIENSLGDVNNEFRFDGYADNLYIVAQSNTGAATGCGFIMRTSEAEAGAYDRLIIAPAGHVGIGISAPTPTAQLTLGAGGTAASSAPLKFTSDGVVLASPEAGAMEYNGANFFLTVSSNRRQIALTNVTSPTNGQIPIGNGTDYTVAAITGTTNQVNVTNASGSITLSLPQSINTTAIPQFSGLGIGKANSGSGSRVQFAAGSTTTAPINYTSGGPKTTPIAGDFEFTTDDVYFTITTGAARKRFLFADASGGLTSGRVPFATTNGRLTDSANMTYVTDRLSPTYLTLAAGTSTAGTCPLVMTSGTLLGTAIAGGVEFLTDKFYATITTGAARKELTLNDAALTSGRVPYVTTNGRLTDVSGFTFTGSVLTISSASDTGFVVSPTANNKESYILLTTASGATVDSYIVYNTTSGENWSEGKDTSDSNAFVISNNVGLGTNNRFKITTTGIVSIFNYLQISIDSDPGAPTDAIRIGAKATTEGTPAHTIHLRTESAVEATATFAQSHRLRIWHNNVEYWIPLDTV